MAMPSWGYGIFPITYLFSVGCYRTRTVFVIRYSFNTINAYQKLVERMNMINHLAFGFCVRLPSNSNNNNKIVAHFFLKTSTYWIIIVCFSFFFFLCCIIPISQLHWFSLRSDIHQWIDHFENRGRWQWRRTALHAWSKMLLTRHKWWLNCTRLYL